MKKELRYLFKSLRGSFSICLTFAPIAFFGLAPCSYAQTFGKTEVPKEREIHNTFSQDQKNGTILDATNPIELINRLRQANALENATSPSDAIDDALKAFNEDDLEPDPAKSINTQKHFMLQKSF
tara:strand:- start:722 stop:1096 length:375 start_codon:yes stop_codon:yes gene_type:complete